MIGRRLQRAAALGRVHGSATGQSAAHGLLGLTVAAMTAAALLFALVVILILWFALLYLWFILLPGWLGLLPGPRDALAAAGPVLAAMVLVLLILRSPRA